ncbi:hypothetical protein NL676_026113 [Syzygium grande]|nr:hypothetical protein NL676_026113 [Syzygium grande]
MLGVCVGAPGVVRSSSQVVMRVVLIRARPLTPLWWPRKSFAGPWNQCVGHFNQHAVCICAGHRERKHGLYVVRCVGSCSMRLGVAPQSYRSCRIPPTSFTELDFLALMEQKRLDRDS